MGNLSEHFHPQHPRDQLKLGPLPLLRSYSRNRGTPCSLRSSIATGRVSRRSVR